MFVPVPRCGRSMKPGISECRASQSFKSRSEPRRHAGHEVNTEGKAVSPSHFLVPFVSLWFILLVLDREARLSEKPGFAVRRWLLVTLMVWLAPAASQADVFTVRLDDGQELQVSARLAGAAQDVQALEFSDGRLQLLPADRIVKREPQADPTPISHDAVLERIATEFGADRIIAEIDKPFVIAIVRESNRPLDPAAERRLKAVAQKGGKFFKGMQASFLDFVRNARVEITPVKYPLPAVIFESDRQFDAYFAATTEGPALAAQNISAYYDLLSNRLVIRLRECATFDTPLHEAVHQQVYNRGILQRLAPVPAWFNEGLATGFEGDGERIRSGPKSLSDRYGPLALRAQRVNWPEIIANDRAFQGDVLAAEAYGHAWGLHWLLVTKYRTEYNQLVRHFAAKKPLELDRPDERVAEFERIVGKSVEALQREFYVELQRALNRRKN
jgi:hypothetical protein